MGFKGVHCIIRNDVLDNGYLTKGTIAHYGSKHSISSLCRN